MRGSEVISLTCDDVHLESRIIWLRKHQTKERKPKRVPIHKELVDILSIARACKYQIDLVLRSPKKNRISADSVRQAWNKAVNAAATRMDDSDDLRHVTVKDIRRIRITHAMRSGMDPFIREAIVGHSLKWKDVSARYLSLEDQELVRAIDEIPSTTGRPRFGSRETEKSDRSRSRGNRGEDHKPGRYASLDRS